MKQIISFSAFLMLVFLSSLVAHGQSQTPDVLKSLGEMKRVIDNLADQVFTNKQADSTPKTRITNSRYANGQLEWEGAEDGNLKKVGLWKTYYFNGQLKSIGNFKNGLQDSLWREYHENGQLYIEENYIDGKKDGLSKRYSNTGILQSETSYKEGGLDGISRSYYENGQLKNESHYKAGMLDGVSKQYDENGQLEYEESSIEGKMQTQQRE